MRLRVVGFDLVSCNVETVVTLIVVGAVMMLLETVLPGVIVGLVGFGCVVAGVVTAYMTQDIETAHWILLGVLAGLATGTALWFRFFPVSPMARLFISKGRWARSMQNGPIWCIAPAVR